MGILMTADYIAGTAYPLYFSRIGWQNVARTAVITASGVASGAYLQAPISDQTWEWWQPLIAADCWWAATFASPTLVDYCGIAAHELGSAGATVQVQYDAGGGWFNVPGAVVNPTDDSPIMICFDTIPANAMRVHITGASFAPHVSVIHFGKVLEMPRPAKWMGHTPGILNRQFETRPNMSERGQRLGNSLIREGLAAAFEFSNLDENWVRSTFDLFMRNCMRYGYFMAWRPEQFDDEVFYGWTDKAFPPVNSQKGVNRRMSVSWQMDCHSHENVTAWESS